MLIASGAWLCAMTDNVVMAQPFGIDSCAAFAEARVPGCM